MLCIWKFDLNKYQENVNISSIGSGQYLYRDNVKKKKINLKFVWWYINSDLCFEETQIHKY